MIPATSAKDKIILPLDVPDEKSALRLIDQLAGQVSFYKIGLELFIRCGPGIIERVKAATKIANGEDGRVFLDLKLHDIPNTVAGAVRSAVGLGVDMLTVHLSGGGAMLRAASTGAGSTLLLGVSVLTSSDANTLHETGVAGTVDEQVVWLARLGMDNGLRGVVASPHEVGALRARFGDTLTVVTPGVRPAWASGDDQRRVLTPRQAVEAGADYLVIGRPITAQADPAAAAARIVAELTDATPAVRG